MMNTEALTTLRREYDEANEAYKEAAADFDAVRNEIMGNPYAQDLGYEPEIPEQAVASAAAKRRRAARDALLAAYSEHFGEVGQKLAEEYIAAARSASFLVPPEAMTRAYSRLTAAEAALNALTNPAL